MHWHWSDGMAKWITWWTDTQMFGWSNQEVAQPLIPVFFSSGPEGKNEINSVAHCWTKIQTRWVSFQSASRFLHLLCPQRMPSFKLGFHNSSIATVTPIYCRFRESCLLDMCGLCWGGRLCGISHFPLLYRNWFPTVFDVRTICRRGPHTSKGQIGLRLQMNMNDERTSDSEIRKFSNSGIMQVSFWGICRKWWKVIRICHVLLCLQFP